MAVAEHTYSYLAPSRARAAKRNPRPLLALTTHRGGRLDPDVLVEREQRAGRLLNRPDAADRTQAKLRTLRDLPPIPYSPSVVERKVYNDEERFLNLEPARIPREFGSRRELLGPSAARTAARSGSMQSRGARGTHLVRAGA